MAGLNINAGAQGNPLDALLNGRPQWGQLGGLLVPLGAGYSTEGGDTVYGQGYLGPNDPRWQLASDALSNYNGKGQYTQLRNDNIGGPGGVLDPSKVIYDPQYGMLTPSSNVNAPQDDWMANYMPFIIAGLGSAAAIAGASGAAGAAGSTGATAPIDVSTSDLGALGTVNGEGATVGAAGTAGGTAGSSLDFGGYTGGIDPETAAGQGGMGVAQNGIGPGSFTDQLAGAINNPSSLLGSNGLLSQGAQSLGSWAISHPLQAAGLVQTASGLLHRNSGASGSSGKSSGGSGLPAGSLNIPAVNYTPNPYLMAQLQRGYQ